MGIWLIALALVFNGVTMSSWNGPPRVSAAMAQGHHDGVDLAARSTASDHDTAIATDAGQTRSVRHNHLKCCWTCNIPSLLPNVTTVPVTFSYRAAVFYVAQRHLVGHPVALDPGIPKSIV